MLEMLLNLQPQGLAQGKLQEGGEKQAEELLNELGLTQAEEVKDFVSLLQGEQKALTQKGLEEAKQMALDLANSGKEAASELGLKVLAKLSAPVHVPEEQEQKKQEQKNDLARLEVPKQMVAQKPSMAQEDGVKVETAHDQTGPLEKNRPQTLMEKLGFVKEGSRGDKITRSDEVVKELSRLRSHGPELAVGAETKSKGMSQKPLLMSAEDFLGQKQLKSAEPDVSTEVAKAKMSAQMLQKYENGQKVIDRQMISLKGSGPQVSAEGSLKSPVELEAEIQNQDSSKMLKDIGVMKLPDAPKAAGNQGNNIDMGKPNILDMGKLDMSKPQQVIDKIVEYIDKAQFDRTQKLDLVVRHEKLGQFQMQVNKSGANSELIDLRIQAQGSEAHRFFKEHEVDLMKTLTKNGVRLGEFKLTQAPESSSFAQNSENNKDSQTGQGQKYSQGQSQDKDQADRDSQRRRSLWEQYQERYGA